jgi:hypothetical protein
MLYAVYRCIFICTYTGQKHDIQPSTLYIGAFLYPFTPQAKERLQYEGLYIGAFLYVFTPFT